VKNFRANSVFQGKHKLFKILYDVKYIFDTANSGQTLFFKASPSCSKILNVKCIFNKVKIFRANSVFQGKRSCSKILNSKICIQYSENFQGNSFSGQAQVAKNPEQ